MKEQSRGSGKALVKLLQESPLRDVPLERTRTRGRVRSVELSPFGFNAVEHPAGPKR